MKHPKSTKKSTDRIQHLESNRVITLWGKEIKISNPPNHTNHKNDIPKSKNHNPEQETKSCEVYPGNEGDTPEGFGLIMG